MGQPPSGPTHLLVVSHWRGRRAHVQAKAQVGFVVAHAQSGGGHHGFDLVVAQLLFNLEPTLGIALSAVSANLVAQAVQKGAQPLGLGHGQNIHNPRPWQALERIGDPGVALQGRQPRHHRQRQRGACQRAAKGHAIGAQLLTNVACDPFIGGGGGGQHAGCWRGQQRTGQALVVGPEIKAPVADAVRLVDDDQAHLTQQLPEPCGKARVAQALGRNQQHVERVRVELLEHLVPFVEVGRIDAGRLQARPLRRCDLVAHERQQWRDDQRGAGATRSQGTGGGPVHR